MRTPSKATAGVLGMANPAYWVRTTNTDNGSSLSLSLSLSLTHTHTHTQGNEARSETPGEGRLARLPTEYDFERTVRVPTAPSTTR